MSKYKVPQTAKSQENMSSTNPSVHRPGLCNQHIDSKRDSANHKPQQC